MKKRLILLLTVVGTFIAASVSAQPWFSAQIGVRLPHARVVFAPPPPQVVVYNQPVCEQPVYDQPGYDQPVYSQPVYNQPACNEPVIYDNRVFYETRRPVYYHENIYARPRYVEVNRYRNRYDNRGYREDRNQDHRYDGHRRW